MSGPHPLELLGHANRGHPRPPGARLAGQVRAHHLQLGIILAEPDPRDLIGLGERGDRPAEPVPELPEQHRRGKREPQVPGQERHHLRTGLQDRHVRVEIDPVQALDVQHHMPVEHVVHRDNPLVHPTSVRSSRRSRDPRGQARTAAPATLTPARNHSGQPAPLAVRGWPHCAFPASVQRPCRHGGQAFYLGGGVRRERLAEPPFSPDGSPRGTPASPATGLASQIASFTSTICSLSAAKSA